MCIGVEYVFKDGESIFVLRWTLVKLRVDALEGLWIGSDGVMRRILPIQIK